MGQSSSATNYKRRGGDLAMAGDGGGCFKMVVSETGLVNEFSGAAKGRVRAVINGSLPGTRQPYVIILAKPFRPAVTRSRRNGGRAKTRPSRGSGALD